MFSAEKSSKQLTLKFKLKRSGAIKGARPFCFVIMLDLNEFFDII